MTDGLIDPVQTYEYNQLVDKSNRVNKGNTSEEFLSMIVEQIFFNKVFSSTSFVSEEEDDEGEGGETVVIKNNPLMDTYFKDTVISQLSETDSFGLLDALKKRGSSNGR